MKASVPTYGLYGEASEAVPDFWIHAESIRERSSRHNWEIKKHRHDHFFQILHLSAGTGDAVVGEDSHRLMPGVVLFVPEKTTHGFRFSNDTDGIVITLLTARLPLQAGTGPIRTFVSAPRILQPEDANTDARYVSTTLYRIGEELAAGFGARDDLLEAYLTTVFILCSSMDVPGQIEDAASGRDIARIARLNRLVGAHFREHLPVEFYARELGVSVTHLNRITKAQTGRTMNELLSDKIILQAKRDLVFTIQTAQEIAYALGFSDPAYFTRFFSREAGETPRQFRERERSRQQRPAAAE
jgi:AraC family transcriptional activator of pobA